MCYGRDMTIPISLLIAALAAVIAAVCIAYRSGCLMGAESHVRLQNEDGYARYAVIEVAFLALGRGDVDGARYALKTEIEARRDADDIATVRERRACDSRTPGRTDASSKAVNDEVRL